MAEMTFKQKRVAIQTLEKFADSVGGWSPLADLLGVSRRTPYVWRESGVIPAEHAKTIDVESDGQFSRETLRPDLFE